MFASEPRPSWPTRFQRQADLHAISKYLSYQYVPTPESALRAFNGSAGDYLLVKGTDVTIRPTGS